MDCAEVLAALLGAATGCKIKDDDEVAKFG